MDASKHCSGSLAAWLHATVIAGTCCESRRRHAKGGSGSQGSPTRQAGHAVQQRVQHQCVAAAVGQRAVRLGGLRPGEELEQGAQLAVFGLAGAASGQVVHGEQQGVEEAGVAQRGQLGARGVAQQGGQVEFCGPRGRGGGGARRGGQAG